MTPRNFPASPRIASSSAIVSRSLTISSSRLRAPEACEPSKRHVQDVRRLNLREGERLCHERARGSRPIVGPPDRGDDGIQHLDRLEQPFDDMRPGPGPFPGGTAIAWSTDLDLMVDVVTSQLGRGSRFEAPRPRVRPC